jgi:uncharacterized protein YciI
MLFLILLQYNKPVAAVEQHLDEHRQFLEKYYQSKHFICSGPRHPRTGGVILCHAKSRKEVEDIIREDPFDQYQLADYEIIAFEPTRYAEGFAQFL